MKIRNRYVAGELTELRADMLKVGSHVVIGRKVDQAVLFESIVCEVTEKTITFGSPNLNLLCSRRDGLLWDITGKQVVVFGWPGEVWV